MTLEERAREFVDREIFTDGALRRANRLVMEFETKIPGTGWGKAPMASKFEDFARPYDEALRGLYEATNNRDGTVGIEEAFGRLREALARAEAVLK